jgi:hypothetical protein
MGGAGGFGGSSRGPGMGSGGMHGGPGMGPGGMHGGPGMGPGGMHGGPGMPPPRYHGGPGAPPPRHYRGGGCFSSFFSAIATFIIVIVIVIFTFANQGGGSSRVQIDSNTYANTTERTKLDKSVTTETDYYYDELGYISQKSVLLKGLKYFYSETGVQPVVYITDNTDASAASLYDEICSDEGHFLLVVIGSKDGSTDWEYDYCWGSAAAAIMDSEAEDIFFAYLDSYYYGDYTDEEVFANAFTSTADTIMSSTTNGFDVMKVVIIGIIIIVVLLILVSFWKARTKQKNKEQEDLERTLNTPLEEYGDSTLNDLKDKYDN